MYIYYQVFLFIQTYKFYNSLVREYSPNKTAAIDIDYW